MSLIKALTYQALEAVTLGRGVKRRIGGEIVRFPARWSRYYPSEYEPETFDFLQKHLKKGATVLDIGAHIGLFSIIAARLVGEKGKVFSFEPTPFTRSVLSKVVELNNCTEIIEVRDEAVSDAKGTATFYDTGDSEVSNANSLVKTARSRGEIEIQLTTVDDFAEENGLKIDCLKIDVEGAELDLLRGASKTFLNNRPIAHLSLHPAMITEKKQSLVEIWDLLETYQLKVLYKDKPVDKDWFCGQKDLFDVCLFPVKP
jgi:FkbM family methyltransferase